MPEEQQQQLYYNTPFKGMVTDSTLSQAGTQSVTYALNAVVEGSSENSSIVYQNEEANQLTCQLPTGFKVCGLKNIIEEGVIILFLCTDDETQSEIGKVVDDNYTTYVSHPGLNFSITDPIHEISYKRTNCDTEIYWASQRNPRRFISINNIPYIDDDSSKGLDLNKILVNPNFAIPSIEILEILPTGDNQAGVYQFTCQYANAIGEGYTSYYSVTNPTPLFDKSKSTLDFNYLVTKSISLKITGLDTTGFYDYVNVVVIKTINNISTPELIGTYPITDSTLDIIYSGQKQNIPVTMTEIFAKNPIYPYADGVYNVQDVLGWYGVKTQERISYQEIASQINLQWETYRLNGNAPYANPINANKYLSYMRDEIYPYEIVFLLKNGYQTDGFTIPSRAATQNDLILVDGKPKWQVENTATLLDYTEEYKLAVNKTTYEGPYQYGEFAYWESTEKYPNNSTIYGSLVNTPIRHHKFPDSAITHIHGTGNDKDYIYPIGIKVDIDAIKLLIQTSSLTQEQKDNIQGFKIVRGNRAANKTVIAKGIIRDVLQYSNNGQPINTDNNFGASSSEIYVISQLQNIVNILKDANANDNRGFTSPIGQMNVDNLYNQLQSVLTFLLISPTVYPNIPEGIKYPSRGLDSLNPTSYKDNLNILINGGTFNSTYVKGINSLINIPVTVLTETKVITSSAKSQVQTAQNLITNLIQQYDQANNSSNINQVSSELADLKETNFYFPNYLFNDIRTTNNEDQYLKNITKPLSNTRYTFHSPDTSFYQPGLGSSLKLETIEYGFSSGRFFPVKEHAGYKIFTDGLYFISLGAAAVITLTSRWFVVGLANGGTVIDGAAAIQTYQTLVNILEKTVPFVNYAYQFNAVGNYTNYTPIKNETPLELYSYLSPYMNNVGDTLNINNWQRESSVYLKTKQSLPTIPLNYQDTSKNFPASLQETVSSPISVYYTSIKNNIPNVWGTLYSYDTIDTGFQVNLVKDSGTKICFGGDTFINKFSFKTKIPFFIENKIKAPDGADPFYDEWSNVGQAKYWYTAKTKAQAGSGFLGSLTGTLFGTKAHQLYNDSSEILYRSGQMFLFAYGIPTFYCESTINVDLRQAFNSQEGNFFPNVGTSIPNDWLQEINVPIVQDNTYYYNKTYSKQNKETGFAHLPQDYTLSNCRIYYPFRTVFSEVAKDIVNPEERNNWLIYKPSSFFDLPQNYGKLTSITGIENKQALTRFENKTLLYNALYTAPTSAGQVYLGKSLFDPNTPPLDFSDTDLGYIGSQHKFILKTEYGIITADALRGQIFQLQGQQPKDISLQGMSKFFTEFLNFSILKTYPKYPIDNHFNGVGLTGTYDSKYNRLILTKLDYEVKKKNLLFDDKGFYISKETRIPRSHIYITCREGYTLINNLCTKTEYIDATHIGGPSLTATKTTGQLYNAAYGTFLYETYNVNGTSGTQLNPTYYVISGAGGNLPTKPLSSLWNNYPQNTTNGRLNKNSLWTINPATSKPYVGDIPFTFEFELNEEKDYFIGIGVNNKVKITINCEVVLDQDPLAIGQNHNMAGSTETTSTFILWHIYKISLNKGKNYVTIIATNDSTGDPPTGDLGFEIYNNTADELKAASQEADLNIVYSSLDFVNKPLTQVNYSCESCNNIVLVDGEYKCPTVLTETPQTVTVNDDEIIIEKEYIPFTDSEYFINKSFTISYDFDNQAWISFHSYLPNFYIQEANYFYTGLNSQQSSIWSHQTTMSEFQKFYNQQAPYILEIPYQFKLQDEILQSIVDYHTVLKIDNFQEYVESDDNFFNKLILYTNQQCSGLLELTKKPLSNLRAYNEYPKYKTTSKEVLYTKSDNLYKINTFWDVTLNSKKPNFIASSNSLSEFKILNQVNMNYNPNSYKKAPLRTKELKVRYILDNHTDIKVQSKLTTIQSSKSYK